MSGGDDLEGLTEEATANAQLGDEPGAGEHTLSTYWKVQAMKSRGETRVVHPADLADEIDPEEPTDPLPTAAPASPPPPSRGRGLMLVLLAALLLLAVLACAGLGTAWFLMVQQGPGEPEPVVPVAPPVPAELMQAPAPTADGESPALPVAPPPSSAPTVSEPAEVSAAVPPTEPEPVEPEPVEPEPVEPVSGADRGPQDPDDDDEGIDLSDLTLSDLGPPAAVAETEPTLLIGPLSMTGPGSEPQLRNVIVLAEPRLMTCYTEALALDPVLEASLDLNLRLLADGTVLGARARQRGRKLEPLGSCVERAMLSERFPGLTSAVSLVVPLSFQQQPGSAED